jgi:hypothetical protein
VPRPRLAVVGQTREPAAPPWLVEVVRPGPAAPPWPRMIRAPLAICLPLGVGLVTGHVAFGLPSAMGALISSVVERGGPYLERVKRVGTVAMLGSALGLVIGMLIHGRGWIAVAVIVVLALVSAVISAAGNVGSVTGMQLLLFAVLGIGPLGLLGPSWLVVGLFLAGAAWGTGVSVLGWVYFPRAPQQRSIAEMYRAAARMLRAIGTDGFDGERQSLMTALDTAFDEMLTARASVAGADAQQVRLVGLLNQTQRVVEASLTLAHEGIRLGLPVIHRLNATADAIQHSGPTPAATPRAQADTPGGCALREALAAVNAVLAGNGGPSGQPAVAALSGCDRLRTLLAEVRNGRSAAPARSTPRQAAGWSSARLNTRSSRRSAMRWTHSAISAPGSRPR